MLTFTVQQKILGDILKNSSNLYCADCFSKSPTWASLDFGVFLCSNCAGAHRALGPTITRVRSSKLDQWNKDWVQNMKIGNSQLNKYWQSDNSCSQIKPKVGASLQQINRYVVQKYIKKKYVNSNQNKHPLQAYKDGEYHIEKKQESTENQNNKNAQINAKSVQNTKIQKNANQTITTNSSVASTKPVLKFEGDLLEIGHTSTQPQTQKNCQNDDDQFTEYHSPETHDTHVKAHLISNTNVHSGIHQQQSHDPNNIKYEDLFKLPQQTNSHNHNPQYLHTPINMTSNHINMNSTHNHYNHVNINGHTYVNNGYHHQQPHTYQNFTNFNGNYAGYNSHVNNFHQNNHYNHYNNHGMNINSPSMKMSNNLNGNYNQAPLSSYQAQIPTIQSNWTL